MQSQEAVMHVADVESKKIKAIPVPGHGGQVDPRPIV
jgi:hypothetical protein